MTVRIPARRDGFRDVDECNERPQHCDTRAGDVTISAALARAVLLRFVQTGLRQYESGAGHSNMSGPAVHLSVDVSTLGDQPARRFRSMRCTPVGNARPAFRLFRAAADGSSPPRDGASSAPVAAGMPLEPVTMVPL